MRINKIAIKILCLLAAVTCFGYEAPPLPAELVPFYNAIRIQESGRNPWQMMDNTNGKSTAFKTEAALLEGARARIEELKLKGHAYPSIDLGVHQVNWKYHHQRTGNDLARFIDIKTNAAMGQTILVEFYNRAKRLYSRTDDAIRMAVGAYNGGNITKDMPKYTNGVYRIAGLAPPYLTTGTVGVDTKKAVSPQASVRGLSLPAINNSDTRQASVSPKSLDSPLGLSKVAGARALPAPYDPSAQNDKNPQSDPKNKIEASEDKNTGLLIGLGIGGALLVIVGLIYLFPIVMGALGIGAATGAGAVAAAGTAGTGAAAGTAGAGAAAGAGVAGAGASASATAASTSATNAVMKQVASDAARGALRGAMQSRPPDNEEEK